MNAHSADPGITSICIADFGISKDIEQSQAKTLAGSQPWMAPEVHNVFSLQNRGKPSEYDGKKADGNTIQFL